MNVLISLYRGYGMGDAVQMSAVLQHVCKYHPHWCVDFQAEEGRQCVGNGIVHKTFAYGDPHPTLNYDAEVQIVLYDTWANWHDRPNTRVSSCLHERFGLEWDAECGRYQINVDKNTMAFTQGFMTIVTDGMCKKEKVVAVHYQGDSSPAQKNLSHIQALEICGHIEDVGCFPLLLDWRGKSPLHGSHNFSTVGNHALSCVLGRDAGINCAVISQCAAFVGIDSGPSKCASATNTPALVTWTGHHPAPFHDPAPNTTHLVPKEYHGLAPVCNDEGVIKWFEAHHKVRQYKDDPIGEIKTWLTEVLR